MEMNDEIKGLASFGKFRRAAVIRFHSASVTSALMRLLSNLALIGLILSRELQVRNAAPSNWAIASYTGTKDPNQSPPGPGSAAVPEYGPQRAP